ncbi:MAG: hypothetical protein ABSE58_04945 [Candidatus Limnocylindrales bacterium]|jgi:hypothetical protein
MAWGSSSSPGEHPLGFSALGSDVNPRVKYETIQLVGPHLRVSGEIAILNFNRLSDLINHSMGFVRLTDARLLRRNGEPTNLVVPELMVNQDEITFIGQSPEVVSTAPSAAPVGGMDRPLMERVRRQLVIFTAGHTLTGTIFLFPETDIANFVDTPDPRFVPLVAVTARSLADRRVISHFGLVLVNRTQMTAASFLEKAGGANETGVALE